eukprot:TRINITY_DN63070_c1_g1_i1.p2 TRINITY_DN63070_c1_g1~~TRINITY_DN63070_c1_g1_i1.p2  ORF type:complete len:138 (+),score=38.86 TRINITY_DN63070_c1_g1_i1:86-499(+)
MRPLAMVAALLALAVAPAAGSLRGQIARAGRRSVRGSGAAGALRSAIDAASGKELPTWVLNAPVMYEKGEVTESPYPLQMSPPTFDGPRLTPESINQLEQWGGTLPPLGVVAAATTAAPAEAAAAGAAANGSADGAA